MWFALLLLAIDLANLNNRELLARANAGDHEARLEAALRNRAGKLPTLGSSRANLWFNAALKLKLPLACLEEAKLRIDSKRDPEDMLRCAAAAKLPEARYLLGRLILNRTAAEDENERFEGLALLALSAKSGYALALRRWDTIVDSLTAEDLERVEQKTNQIELGQ